MDLATKVNIILCILSFILAFISIITVIITLRQNQQMLENSSRPYVCIYFDYIQAGEPTGYFMVKNFGQSSAYIDSLTYNDAVKRHPKHFADLTAILDGLIGNSIAPGQKYFAPFKLYEYKGGVSSFDIRYHSGQKCYSEHFEIAVDNYAKCVKPRNTSKEYQAISYPLQEITERLM